MHKDKTPTIADVAREAGVSPYTVSGVLNGARTNTRVSAATRERIMASAARLRYQPNAQARNLARRCTKTLGILFDFVRSYEVLTTSYSSAVLQGIVAESAARGYDILLYTETNQDGKNGTGRFGDQRTDGIIVVAPRIGAHLTTLTADLAASRTPLIAISADPWQYDQACCPSVDVDNARGIEIAVAHLAARGHKRIAHLTGNADMYSVGVRRQAFCQAMQAHGLEAAPNFITTCAYNGTLVPEAMETLMALPEPPTALVAGNDNIALAVMEFAGLNGFSIPGDLSVIGFDDIDAASFVRPKLTTIRQPLTEIGANAARLLIERIEKGASSEGTQENYTTLLSPELIMRESTSDAPLPITHFTDGRRTPHPKGHLR